MKKYLLCATLVLLSTSLIAQQDTSGTQVETLFGGDIESGGYGGPFVQFGQINGETGVFVGGQGGWIIDHRFVLGLKGYGLVNETKVDGFPDLKLEFGCGGALLEYIISSDNLIHFSVHSLIGAGGVKYAVKDYRGNDDDVNYNDDAFFVMEPGASVILNVNQIMRVGAGINYRYVSGVDYEELSNSDLSGVSFGVFFKFGQF